MLDFHCLAQIVEFAYESTFHVRLIASYQAGNFETTDFDLEKFQF